MGSTTSPDGSTMDVPPVGALFDLSGRVAVVTGAGRGIGAVVARRLAEAGAAVVVHYRTSRDAAEGVAGRIQEDGGRAFASRVDLRDLEGAAALMQAAVDTFGGLDILVNNVGTYPAGSLEEMSLDEWRAVYESNVEATFLCTRAVVGHMRRSRAGSIVNIASIAGTVPAPAQSHYSSAKAAVIAFSRASAQELGPYGIRVNAVSPGLISRAGIQEEWPEGVARWEGRAPLSRLGMPEDVADACLFLASPAARWITGHNLLVDGGMLAAPSH
jgi:NAD(P)-dependent dehydrogenase (short-subunit alcohol dehydrogenase family)